jgi:hypothetical protein
VSRRINLFSWWLLLIDSQDKYEPYKVVVPLSLRQFHRETGGKVLPVAPEKEVCVHLNDTIVHNSLYYYRRNRHEFSLHGRSLGRIQPTAVLMTFISRRGKAVLWID